MKQERLRIVEEYLRLRKEFWKTEDDSKIKEFQKINYVTIDEILEAENGTTYRQ